jgi:hypothetical protein
MEGKLLAGGDNDNDYPTRKGWYRITGWVLFGLFALSLIFGSGNVTNVVNPEYEALKEIRQLVR